MLKINDKQARVCIDPGHGGHDPGAVGPTGVRESDVVLKISKELIFQLDELGIDSYLTRTEDEYIRLRDRTEESEGSDCMISVHCNAHSSQAQGIETIYPKAGGPSKALANYVQQSLMKYTEGHRNRGIKMSPSQGYPRTLSLMANAVVPTCLTEVEFISNTSQEEWLKTDEGIKQIAHALANGIKSFLMSLPGAIKSDEGETRAITSDDRGDERHQGGRRAISPQIKSAKTEASLNPEIASLLDKTSKQLRNPNACYPDDDEVIDVQPRMSISEAKPKRKSRKKTGLKRKTKRKSKA